MPGIFLKVICVAGICNIDQRFQNGRAMKVYECIAEEEKQNWNASKKILTFNYYFNNNLLNLTMT